MEYNYAAFGISGLETAVPLLITEIVGTGAVSPGILFERMTAGPARILGLESGTLRAGTPADLTAIDPNLEKEVDPARFFSKGKNTPLAGRKLKGWPVLTVAGGKIVFRDGEIID